jgi:LytS/YehU family sensor histidine kinase
MYFILRGYEAAGWFNIRFSEPGFIWASFAMGITNIFLTFLMEGISRYRDWQAKMREAEKLNAAYRQSQLNGLKSQVNPHFLFNSLNSLSSLIQEDEEKAEDFLNEMSKVYRYMLRPDEEQLVTLDTELKFLSSYHHLLKTRYGDGLILNVDVSNADREKLIAPLTLQVIIENTFSENTLSKSAPLHIEIASVNGGLIYVKNNKQPRPLTDESAAQAGINNIVKKYELLGNPLTINNEVSGVRVIFIPLMTGKKEEAL